MHQYIDARLPWYGLFFRGEVGKVKPCDSRICMFCATLGKVSGRLSRDWRRCMHIH